MPPILTTNAKILCPHGGVGTSIPTDLRGSINGGTVLLDGDQGILSCFFLIPCGGYFLKSMGLNATKIGERPVMLTTDFTQSFTGFPLFMTEIHQVIDDSTPAPIAPGQSAPPLSPELADIVPPIVTGVMPINTVRKSSPAPIAMTFSLTSPFPRSWILTWLSIPGGGKTTPITNGLDALISVSPSGGTWDQPALSVSVELASTWVTSLDVKTGRHDFVLTAVNKRGLAGFAQLTLTVNI